MKLKDADKVIFKDMIGTEGWILYEQMLDEYIEKQKSSQLDARELAKIEMYRAKREAIADIKKMVKDQCREGGER